jgi:hypothetical protein
LIGGAIDVDLALSSGFSNSLKIKGNRAKAFPFWKELIGGTVNRDLSLSLKMNRNRAKSFPFWKELIGDDSSVP